MSRRLTRLMLPAIMLPAIMLPAIIATNLACNRDEDCKCAAPEYALRTFPEADTIDIPTNTRIWGSAVEGLLDKAGVAVPLTQSTISDTEDFSSFTVLHPIHALDPHSMYTITTSSGTQTFTTGPGPQTTPPPIPEIETMTEERSRDCGGSLYRATYTLQGAGIIFLLDTADRTTLIPADLAGDVTAFSEGPEFWLGATCGGFENVPSAPTRNATTTVRFGALDLAGNFSGWSEPEDLTFSGCNLGNTSSSTLTILVPLLLLRRRRSPARR